MPKDAQTSPLIEIDGLSVGFRARRGGMLAVLRDVSLSVARGETVGIVGESGSGKSTLALAAMGFLKPGLRKLQGDARFAGQDVFAMSRPELEGMRGGKLGLIPQNSGQALTPTMRIGTQLCEALALHCKLEASECSARAETLLEQVRLPDARAIMQRFPHELSGGQQQRVAIAMALAGEPEALLLDEPTTGLDVTTQAHILELLRDLAAERNMAMVFVSHDLGVIAHSCARVAVMYAGQIVLDGPSDEVLKAPVHPYPKALLSSIPLLGDQTLPAALDGRPPPPGGGGTGCSFVGRCTICEEKCHEEAPALEQVTPDTKVRCFAWQKVAATKVAKGTAEIAHPCPDGAQSLSLDDVALSYRTRGPLQTLLKGPDTAPMTVDGVTLTLRQGETLGLVGESGSGKSTILKAIAGLLPPKRGEITVGEGAALPPALEHRRPEELRRIQMIFQNPDQALNPRQTVAEILAQPLRLYYGLSAEDLRARSVELLDEVRLGAHYMDRLPGQLSGGEKQRLAVARAFAAEPEIVLCDEVTSALDVSVQAAVLDLLNDLKRDRQTTYVFVSHDLAVVQALSDQVAVLYQGRLCEHGPTKDVFGSPSHPYTKVLLGAVLEPVPGHEPELQAQDVPELSPPAQGCPFQRRCPRKLGAVCDRETPPAHTSAAGHVIRCHVPLSEL